MPEESTKIFIRQLVKRWPELGKIYDEQVRDAGGEVLAHLILSDIMRWAGRHFVDQRGTCVEILDWMGGQYPDAPGLVKDLIAVSGIEMLPDPHEPGGLELREMLPDVLRELDPWRL